MPVPSIVDSPRNLAIRLELVIAVLEEGRPVDVFLGEGDIGDPRITMLEQGAGEDVVRRITRGGRHLAEEGREVDLWMR